MSRTTLYKVPEHGPVETFEEFGNSWHGAMYVWGQLAPKYLSVEVHRVLLDNDVARRLWALWQDNRLSRAERATLLSTFDKAMVKREDFAELASLFDDFTDQYPSHNHLKAQAVALRELVNDPTAFAACWRQTSVSADAWMVQDGDEERPYDLSRDEGHFFIFDSLAAALNAKQE